MYLSRTMKRKINGPPQDQEHHKSFDILPKNPPIQVKLMSLESEKETVPLMLKASQMDEQACDNKGKDPMTQQYSKVTSDYDIQNHLYGENGVGNSGRMVAMQ